MESGRWPEQDEQDEESLTIIVDSGADASLFPGHLMNKGKQVHEVSPLLQDAQGTRIQTYGHKDIDIVLTSSEGRKVVLRERVTFCDVVSQPILSFGRLMKAGWSIDGVVERLRNGPVEAPLTFQNRSLLVKGCLRVIRQANTVRTLTVQLSEELKKAAESGFGWQKNNYQNPQFIPELRTQSSKMCRSTLVQRGEQWELVEIAELLTELQDQEGEIEELRGHEQSKVLTFVAEEGNDPEAFSFKIEDEQRNPRPSQSDLEELEVPKAHTDEDFEEFSGIEVPGGVEDDGVDLDDQRVEHEIGRPFRGASR